MALAMERWPERKKAFLLVSLISNFGMLGFFKYFNFFVDNVIVALHGLGLEMARPSLQIVLPVGISFYTFQTLSYTIDVYRGAVEGQHELPRRRPLRHVLPAAGGGPDRARDDAAAAGRVRAPLLARSWRARPRS